MFIITSPGASNPGMICEIRFNGIYILFVSKYQTTRGKPQHTATPVFAHTSVDGKM